MDVLTKKGIIITFYHTMAEYARNYNLTIQSLFSGYDTYSSGMIVVTDGKNSWLLQTTKI